MKILHVLLTRMPVPPSKYGGTERVLWALYQGQTALGHQVKFLTKYDNRHPDALLYNPNKPLEAQVEGWADIVHFHFLYRGELNTPFVCTTHNQQITPATFPKNTIFLGRLHAERSGGHAYVHNGLYWQDYGKPNLDKPKNYVHFLANAKYKDKNLKDSVEIARRTNKHLHVIGSKRYCLKWASHGRYQPYFYIGNDLTFYGMLGGQKKNEVIANSQALIFPVLNYEAFGLAMIESLYLGCPVIGSHCGSLPELIVSEVGVSTQSKSVMIDALQHIEQFKRKICHEYAQDNFNHLVMSKNYLRYYEMVLNGHDLHEQEPKVSEFLPTQFHLLP
ncbi:glycosyltransferase family 4 protein [Moraxella sp. VT-16-12]|uniref:glycosyltransferase family 4 protein n=1 Tax=Moraxella sp. VT-16-12 TaxID=2014877 RepID=UPI000B7EF08F|nr:glycosyltransferase family 4 protein [Moraxella sp. VT-16-12]TWV83508.1 glycosyltransferase family 4 protein [Moraxella sp. VT-16-12]